MNSTVNGFLNLHKSFGLTSHDCVAQVRKLLRLKRVGHAGTLDPAATGVLPIALGKATRLLQYLPQNKAYQATIRFGLQTATDDLEGEVIRQQPCPDLKREQVEEALAKFQGVIQQVPPAYSAIQVQGKRLYEMARAGELVEVQARPVEVFQIEGMEWRSGDFPELEVTIACGPGTYIRSIARDLGDVLGVGGTLAALLRTESSGFDLATSVTLDELSTQIQAETFCPTPPQSALKHLPILELPDQEARRWCQGQRVIPAIGESIEEETVQIYQKGDRFLGIGHLKAIEDGWIVIPQMVFEPL
ncbi:MAG: tRNA pseudouridine(55) synthase TruB [Leptolyngbyaceae cyanobacterium bins.59]|nr:tRNA pseudouridine(55) synthase TruB [Leptolyngbyaceae cyanobacterium bins.59]